MELGARRARGSSSSSAKLRTSLRPSESSTSGAREWRSGAASASAGSASSRSSSDEQAARGAGFEARASEPQLDSGSPAIERATLVDGGDAGVEHRLAERQRGRRHRAVAGASALPRLQALQVFEQVTTALAAADAAQQPAAGVGVQRLR